MGIANTFAQLAVEKYEDVPLVSSFRFDVFLFFFSKNKSNSKQAVIHSGALTPPVLEMHSENPENCVRDIAANSVR